MKKFCKFLLGLTAVAAAIGGVLYFLKNILMKDYLDDYDDDDFDNDLYEEDNEERDYVKITPDAAEGDTESETDDELDNAEAIPDELL
jgi:hypothetical protein